MVGAGLEREVDEHVLGDVEGRLDVQGHRATTPKPPSPTTAAAPSSV